MGASQVKAPERGNVHAAPARAESIGVVHLHTEYSHDGRDSIADLAVWARELGLQFVAITDHAEDLDEADWDELVDDCARHSSADLILFPGLEFRFQGFTGVHLLACGLQRFISPATPEEFIRLTADNAALTIGAHPIIWRRSCPNDVLAALDAVEVWNGAYNTRYLPDPGAMRMVRSLRASGSHTVATVGPDQHDRRNDRELRLHVAAAAPDALSAIRAGHFRARGKTLSIASDGAMSLPGQACLQLARRALDVVERAQERLALARKRKARKE